MTTISIVILAILIKVRNMQGLSWAGRTCIHIPVGEERVALLATKVFNFAYILVGFGSLMGQPFLFTFYGYLKLYVYINLLLTKLDHLTESRPAAINLDIYVPRDEQLSPKRLSEFISNAIEATAHFVLPEAKLLFQDDSGHFKSFDEIRHLFTANRSQVKKEGWFVKKVKDLVPEELFKMIQHASLKNPVKFPLPQIIAGD